MFMWQSSLLVTRTRKDTFDKISYSTSFYESSFLLPLISCWTHPNLEEVIEIFSSNLEKISSVEDKFVHAPHTYPKMGLSKSQ